MRAPAKVASVSRKVTVHRVAGGSAGANSSTQVCASTQWPPPPDAIAGHVLVAGAMARGSPSATIASEKRRVKRSIVPLIAPLLPGVAMTTCGGKSPRAASGSTISSARHSLQTQRTRFAIPRPRRFAAGKVSSNGAFVHRDPDHSLSRAISRQPMSRRQNPSAKSIASTAS